MPDISYCPHCRRELPDANSESPAANVPVNWVSVARFSTLAEAGYVADELNGSGIVAQLQQRQELEPIGESWHTVFVLQVAESDVEQAISMIQRVAAEGPDTGTPTEIRSENAVVPVAGLGWYSLALLVAAGGVAYGGARLAQSAVATDMRGTALGWCLAESATPLESQRPDGSRRLVWYEPNERRIYVADDHDGDGQIDRRRAFSVVEPAL